MVGAVMGDEDGKPDYDSNVRLKSVNGKWVRWEGDNCDEFPASLQLACNSS